MTASLSYLVSLDVAVVVPSEPFDVDGGLLVVDDGFILVRVGEDEGRDPQLDLLADRDQVLLRVLLQVEEAKAIIVPGQDRADFDCELHVQLDHVQDREDLQVHADRDGHATLVHRRKFALVSAGLEISKMRTTTTIFLLNLKKQRFKLFFQASTSRYFGTKWPPWGSTNQKIA